jgi:hypothetical protein
MLRQTTRLSFRGRRCAILSDGNRLRAPTEESSRGDFVTSLSPRNRGHRRIGASATDLAVRTVDSSVGAQDAVQASGIEWRLPRNDTRALRLQTRSAWRLARNDRRALRLQTRSAKCQNMPRSAVENLLVVFVFLRRRHTCLSSTLHFGADRRILPAEPRGRFPTPEPAPRSPRVDPSVARKRSCSRWLRVALPQEDNARSCQVQQHPRNDGRASPATRSESRCRAAALSVTTSRQPPRKPAAREGPRRSRASFPGAPIRR